MPQDLSKKPGKSSPTVATEATTGASPAAGKDADLPAAPKEIGGRDGPDPTRFGDWEKNGRCIDF